jgi:Tfp pilus assembly protein PilF
MSYINDALRKAQQEKDSRYGRYSGIISRLPGPRGHGRAKWIFAAVSLMMLTALFVWWTTADRQERPVTATQATPEKAAAAGQMRVPATSTGHVEPASPTAQTSGTEQAASRPLAATTGPAQPDATGTGPALVATTATGTQASPAASSPRLAQTAAAAKTKTVESAAPAAGRAQAEPASTPVQTAVQKPSPDPEALYRRALAAQQNKKTAAAERLYRRVLALDVRHVRAMNNLGVLYMARGKQDQAIKLFRKAIAFKNDYVDPYYNLACLHDRRNDTAKSMAYLKSAIALDRTVIDWARKDTDLNHIRRLEDFKALLENGK